MTDTSSAFYHSMLPRLQDRTKQNNGLASFSDSSSFIDVRTSDGLDDEFTLNLEEDVRRNFVADVVDRFGVFVIVNGVSLISSCLWEDVLA